MDEQTFQAKFNELLRKIGQLPEDQRCRLTQLAEATKERRARRPAHAHALTSDYQG